MAKTVKAKRTTFQRGQVPSSWKGTIEEWRAAKRTEWKQVMRALDQFEFGSAYVPGGMDLYHMRRAAERVTEAMAEDWVFT